MKLKIVIMPGDLECGNKSKIVFIIFLAFGFLGITASQKCASPNITSSQFEYGYTFNKDLSLTFYGVIESFQMTGTERILTTSNNNWADNYIDARYARGLLEVYTTASFRRYVEEQSSSRINLQVTLVCEDQSRPILVFRINIKKENLYDPQFSKPFYNFSIPLPLYRGFDLTVLEEVSARDIDIFDNKVTFSTNFAGIVAVSTKPETGSDGKTFYSMLTLTAPLIKLVQPVEFTLTATDNGQPPRSSTALIRISPDKNITFTPPPRFEKNVYLGSLNETLYLNLELLVITLDTWTSDVNFAMNGEDAYFFDLASSNNRVRISLARPLVDEDIEERTFFSFAVVAYRNDTMDGSCSVIVKIPQKSSEHRFNKHYYSGSLDKFGNLSIENIAYDFEDYSPDIVFTLSGPDANLFRVSNNESLIRIDFFSDINEINFQDRRYLFVILSANREGIEIANAGVAVLLPMIPKFSQTVYYGRIDKDSSLTFEGIHFDGNVGSNVKSVLIRGDYAENFIIRGSRTELRLELTIPFNETELRALSYIQLTVVAISRADLEGSTEVLIEFPDFSVMPAFERSVYKGYVDKNGTLFLEDVILMNTTYTEGMEFELLGEFKQNFDLHIIENIIKLKVIDRLPSSVLQSEKYLNFIITARNIDGDSASTSIILNVPVFTPPEFVKNFYKGTLDRYYQLDIEDIRIKTDTYEDGIEVILGGKDAKFFRLRSSTVNIMLEINDESLNPDELSGRTSLDLTIVAENKDGLSGRTAVVVEIPVTCGSGNGTCPPCVIPPNDMCPQTTTPEPSDPPTFDRKLYLYRIEPNYVGIIGIISAKTREPTTSVNYSLDITNAHLKSRITVHPTTGQLAAHDSVSPGLYTFQAVAVNPTTNAKGYAMVRLTVDAANECPNGMTTVSSTLLVKHIVEEESHTDLLNAKYGQCVFTIFSMEPNDKEYVKIDSRTYQLTTIAIDREDPIFESMPVAQVLVQLKLNCPGVANSRQRRSTWSRYSTDNSSRSLVLIDDIPFNPYLTTLSLIIEDVNDHSPEFVHPPHGDYIIGYPEVDVYYNLMPEYLIKVEATDRDVGLNAKIRYSMNENDYFQIDPTSGIIYPIAALPYGLESIELVVVAADRDGSFYGRKTRVNLIVKVLTSNYVTMLTINDQPAENFESVLKNVSLEVGAEVYSLRYAMLPARRDEDNSQETFERSDGMLGTADHRIILRAWIYAVDEEGQFVGGSDVEERLNNLHGEYDLETSPYASEVKSDELVADTSGLVAGISVLGVLLFATLVAAFAFWWFWLRPYNFKSISNETTSETISSEDSMDHEMKYKVGNNFYYEDGDTYEAGQQYKKKASMAVSGATSMDTSDESNTNSFEGYSNNSDSSEGSRGQNERRKSIVTFNELVERIDIEISESNFRHHKNNNNDNVRL